MKFTSDVYIKFFTNVSNTEFEFVSLESFMEMHPDAYQDGHSGILYKKVGDSYEFLD